VIFQVLQVTGSMVQGLACYLLFTYSSTVPGTNTLKPATCNFPDYNPAAGMNLFLVKDVSTS